MDKSGNVVSRGIRTRTSSKGRYLRKLFPKIGLGLGDLSSETISEDTYLCWMSECEFRFPAMFPEGGQTRKHCLFAMFPEGGQTRKHCFLAMFPESRQTRKHIVSEGRFPLQP